MAMVETNVNYDEPTTQTGRLEWFLPILEPNERTISEMFADRQVWIQETLARETHTPFTVYGASVDTDHDVLALDAGLVHQSGEDLRDLGARMTTAKVLLTIPHEEAMQLSRDLTEADDLVKLFQTDDVHRANAQNYLFDQYRVSSFEGLRQAMRASRAQQYADRAMARATTIDYKWHGFGGSPIAIEQAARNTLPRWDENRPQTHRVKVLLGIMGCENTRIRKPLGGTFAYRLETHGQNQVTHAIEEFILWTASRKQEAHDRHPDEPIKKIQAITFDGHSMGGHIAFSLALKDAQLNKMLGHFSEIISDNTRRLYIMNAPLTVGARFNRKAVLLLQGWGSLIQLGSAIPGSGYVMQAAEQTKLMDFIHDQFFKSPDNRHAYELASHLVQAGMDPGYIAQCSKSLYQATKLTTIARGRMDVVHDLVAKKQLVATVGQSDIILNPEEQFLDLTTLNIPIFSIPEEDHYLTQQTIIQALLTDRASIMKGHLANWLTKFRVPVGHDTDLPYAEAIALAAEGALRHQRKGKLARALTTNPFTDNPYKHFVKLLHRYYVENGWTILLRDDAFPIKQAILLTVKDNRVTEQINSSEFIKGVRTSMLGFKGVLSVFPNAPDLMLTVLRKASGIERYSAEDQLLIREMQKIMHLANMYSPHGIHTIAANLSELMAAIPSTSSETRDELIAHIRSMGKYEKTVQIGDGPQLYATLLPHVVAYAREIVSPKNKTKPTH